MNFLGFLFRNWLSCVHDRDDLEQTVLKQLFNDYRELSEIVTTTMDQVLLSSLLKQVSML